MMKKDLIKSKIVIPILFCIMSCSSNKDLELIEEAWKLYESRDYQESINVLSDVKDDYCEKRELLGHCNWALNNYNLAINNFRAYSLSCNEKIDVFINLGDSYFKSDMGDSSYFYLMKAYNMDSLNELVNFNLGMIHYTSSYDEDAKRYFKSAINLSDTLNLDYSKMLIKVFNGLSQYDSSFLVTDNLLKQASNITERNSIKLMKAFIYGDMNDFEKLIDETEILIPELKDSMNLFNAYHNMALSYYSLRDSIEYCSNYFKAKSLKPDINVQNYLGCK